MEQADLTTGLQAVVGLHCWMLNDRQRKCSSRKQGASKEVTARDRETRKTWGQVIFCILQACAVQCIQQLGFDSADTDLNVHHSAQSELQTKALNNQLMMFTFC